MHPDIWTANADVIELTLEGNRLVAQEVADLSRTLLRRIGDALSMVVHSTDNHRHLPPV